MRPGRGIDFRNKAAAFLRGGGPGEEHDTRTLLRRGRQPSRNLCGVPLSGWCRIQGCYTLAEQGRVGNPQSAVEELANFCDVSSSHELRTNPLAVDGFAKSWNAMVLQPVPGDGAPAHAAWRAWRGCHTLPQGPQPPCLRPTWQGALI